jgi:hypothetical protein
MRSCTTTFMIRLGGYSGLQGPKDKFLSARPVWLSVVVATVVAHKNGGLCPAL